MKSNSSSIRIGTVILSIMLILSLCTVSADSSYAATKKAHVKKSSVSLLVGKTYQQKLINKKGKAIKAKKVKWKSQKKSVAKISKTGKIKAIKTGTAIMTARYKGKTYRFTVKVTTNRAQLTKSIYKYVKAHGVSNGNLLLGDVWITTSSTFEVNAYEDLVYETCGISVYKSDPSTLYFCVKRERLLDSEYTHDSIEFLSVEYKPNKKKGKVYHYETYYTERNNFIIYRSEADITYSKYRGEMRYEDEPGLSNLVEGDEEEPVWISSDQNEFTEMVYQATHSSNALLKKYLKTNLHGLGFVNY